MSIYSSYFEDLLVQRKKIQGHINTTKTFFKYAFTLILKGKVENLMRE